MTAVDTLPLAEWSPPQFDCSHPPRLAHTAELQDDPAFPHNFVRTAKWCPDGSVALAHCENRSFQFLDGPSELLNSATCQEAGVTHSRQILSQPAPILDFAWFPTATVRDPATFCFVASVRDCPVKLLDAADGRLRASYPIVDHRERFIAPHAMAFNVTTDRFYCGFENAIEVFNVQYPGEGTRLHTTPSRKSRDGLKGIISALAFSTDVNSGMFAAGSLSPSAPSYSNIALFSEATGEIPIMSVGAEDQSRTGQFGVRASVAQLMFNPIRPYLLYASFRRHETIYEWDLRSDVSVPVHTFHKGTASAVAGNASRVNEGTNQKLRFDIDIGGHLLGVGNEHGEIMVFDATTGDSQPDTLESDQGSSAAEPRPVVRYEAHKDAIGSVAFHPLHPLLLSVSGSRHFDLQGNTSESDDGSDSESSARDEDNGLETNRGSSMYDRHVPMVRINRRHPQPVPLDASVKYWSFE